MANANDKAAVEDYFDQQTQVITDDAALVEASQAFLESLDPATVKMLVFLLAEDRAQQLAFWRLYKSYRARRFSEN